MILSDFKNVLTFLGISFGISLSSQSLANDCLSRYKQLIANQITLNGHQSELTRTDKSDLEVRHVLEASSRIESGQWEYGEHTSIEMEHFFSLILMLENPEMEANNLGENADPVLLGHMELAHMLNVASQNGYLCENSQQDGSFFDSLAKIRSDIREGILPSRVTYAEEHQVTQQANSRYLMEQQEQEIFELSDFSSLSRNSSLSLTSLTPSIETEQYEEPQFSDNGCSAESLLPDPGEVEPIDLSSEPPLDPKIEEERGKSKEEHFSELDNLYR